ncbi:MAG: hypothetical protein HDT16_11695 [Oscillibacter sp.]|nr:hypothetical protein [Oscillibacter sp.]
MKDCLPLIVPSNLGETNLRIGIDKGSRSNIPNHVELRSVYRRNGTDYIFDGHRCFIWVKNIKDAQKAAVEMSRQLEERETHSIQSDRIYFLPLLDGVAYKIELDSKKPHKRPIVRVGFCPDGSLICRIYVSSLVQLQETLFSHERNLVKKRYRL